MHCQECFTYNLIFLNNYSIAHYNVVRNITFGTKSQIEITTSICTAEMSVNTKLYKTTKCSSHFLPIMIHCLLDIFRIESQ